MSKKKEPPPVTSGSFQRDGKLCKVNIILSEQGRKERA
jgi:hypothetical protein